MLCRPFAGIFNKAHTDPRGCDPFEIEDGKQWRADEVLKKNGTLNRTSFKVPNCKGFGFREALLQKEMLKRPDREMSSIIKGYVKGRRA